jgi:hypothetical protein
MQKQQSDSSLVAVNKRAAAVDDFFEHGLRGAVELDAPIEPGTRDDYLFRYDKARRAQLLGGAGNATTDDLQTAEGDTASAAARPLSGSNLHCTNRLSIQISLRPSDPAGY